MSNKHVRYTPMTMPTGAIETVRVLTPAGKRRARRRLKLGNSILTLLNSGSDLKEAHQIATRLLCARFADRRWAWAYFTAKGF